MQRWKSILCEFQPVLLVYWRGNLLTMNEFLKSLFLMGEKTTYFPAVLKWMFHELMQQDSFRIKQQIQQFWQIKENKVNVIYSTQMIYKCNFSSDGVHVDGAMCREITLGKDKKKQHL